MAEVVKKAGIGLAAAGGLAYLAIFAIVLVNGTWPDFLEPIQTKFATMEQFLGPLNWPAQIAMFAGPGGLLYLLGERIKAGHTN